MAPDGKQIYGEREKKRGESELRRVSRFEEGEKKRLTIITPEYR